MGKIIAAPTAGSCGILPAALLSVREELGIFEDRTTRPFSPRPESGW
jgi:L-serine dehydratase